MDSSYTDFHLHLLPGVDDGSPALQETFSMVRGLMELGFGTFVCTPHQKEGSINPSLASVQEVYNVVVEEVQERFPSARLLLGAENFYDSQLSRRLDAHEVPTIAGSDVFLLEFPPSIEEKPFRTALFRVQTEGYIPINASAKASPIGPTVVEPSICRIVASAPSEIPAIPNIRMDTRNIFFIFYSLSCVFFFLFKSIL